MAHVVQLILGAFMSSIKVKSRDGHMPSRFKAGYIVRVMRLDNGFHKTVEKVMCVRSHTYHLYYKCIRTNSYAQIYTHKGICTNSLFQIECAPM